MIPFRQDAVFPHANFFQPVPYRPGRRRMGQEAMPGATPTEPGAPAPPVANGRAASAILGVGLGAVTGIAYGTYKGGVTAMVKRDPWRAVLLGVTGAATVYFLSDAFGLL